MSKLLASAMLCLVALLPLEAQAHVMPYGTHATRWHHLTTALDGSVVDRAGWVYSFPVAAAHKDKSAHNTAHNTAHKSAVRHPKRVVHRRPPARVNRPSRPVGGYQAQLSVSAYAPGCGASGAMANNQWPFVGAAAGVYAFGTRISVPGWGMVTVLDRGVPSGYLDLYMNTCYQAVQWGRRTLTVTIY